jgi:hypothetical protein
LVKELKNVKLLRVDDADENFAGVDDADEYFAL